MNIVCIGDLPTGLVGWLHQAHHVRTVARPTAEDLKGAEYAFVADSRRVTEDLALLANAEVPFGYYAEAIDDDRLVSIVLRYPCDSVIEGKSPSHEVIKVALDAAYRRVVREAKPRSGLDFTSYFTLSETGTNRHQEYAKRAAISLVSASTQGLMRNLRSTIQAMDRTPLPTLRWDPSPTAPDVPFTGGKLKPGSRPPLSQLFGLGRPAAAERLGMGEIASRRADFPQPGMALIRGESGSGKTLIADLMWRAFSVSRQWTDNNAGVQMPYVKINCGAKTAKNFDHEMFGSAPGYWSGIDKPVVGELARADYGVAFLDEIGDMEQSAQSRLKAVLDDLVICPFGLDPYYLHLRVVAATNVALETSGFQHDLFRRFAFTLDVPALNDRKEELPRLIAYAAQNPMINPPRGASLTVTGMADAAVKALRDHDWSHGNYRELGQVVGRAVFKAAQAGRAVVTIDDVRESFGAKALPTDARQVVRISKPIVADAAVEVASEFDLAQAATVHGVPILRHDDTQWVRSAVGTYVYRPEKDKENRR